uniref:Uncharacterized protein n=1 Tax=Magallana gigas TaxID=29159 RepID=A0A8W8MB24_MAGGI
MCGQCAADGSCDQITWSCVDNCNPGYTGSNCEEACPSTCGGDGSCLRLSPYCSYARLATMVITVVFNAAVPQGSLVTRFLGKRKTTLPSHETYESRLVLSKGENAAYDKINKPENVYLELNGMSTTASFPTYGEGNQYYSTVGSIRDHAKFRSDNRALADPASSREGIISDGQSQRVSEAHAYLYLIP